jgi:hypothetical protein
MNYHAEFCSPECVHYLSFLNLYYTSNSYRKDSFKVYRFKIFTVQKMYMKEHQKYQSTRIMAFYETDRLPSLPEPVEEMKMTARK